MNSPDTAPPNTADAVVIGAGPNGLVAANVLADAGWDVVVLEAQPVPGGAVRSAELVEPGYVNDTCSAFYPFAPVSPLAALHLEDHGLRWARAPLTLAHPAPDGTCPVLAPDPGDTAERLEALHAGDGAAWLSMWREWQRVGDVVMDALLGPFPPVRAGARLLARTRHDVLRGARSALLPVRRLGEEQFGGEAARRFLTATALHADLGPETAGGAVYGWLLLMLGQQHGFPVPIGGAGQVTSALVARLRARGGEVWCGYEVDRVLVEGGRATGVISRGHEVRARRAVLADVDAPQLFHRLVGDDRLPTRFVSDLRRFQWDHATVKVDWTLDRPVPWATPDARRAGTVHVADSVDDLTRQHSAVVRGLLPARPFLLVGQQSMTDPSRQPPGHETLWAYTHVPQHVVGDEAGEVVPSGGTWSGPRGGPVRGGLARDDLHRFADRIEDEIERLAPGFRDAVRGRHVAGPSDFEDHDQNLVGGAVGAGTAQLHQMAVFRPVPGWGRPETPVRRLFLASASAHPGGALHGAPGANAARAALLHDRLGILRRPWSALSSRSSGPTPRRGGAATAT